VRASCATFAVLAVLAALALGAPVTDAQTTPAVTKVTPYVAGRTLTWSAFAQYGVNGDSPNEAASLAGVSGGSMGMVITGRDVVANSAATWVSRDGGGSWTEHLVPGSTSLGRVVGHGGVLVALSDAFWSSVDGATWSRAATGPHAITSATLAAGPSGFIALVRNGASTTTRVWRSATGASSSWIAAATQAAVSSFCASSIAASAKRIVAIGERCGTGQPRVVVSLDGGRTWVSAAAPSGLRVAGQFTRSPSISYVGSRFVVTGTNSAETATWVWSSTTGSTWRHIASMPRTTAGPFSTDTIVGIFQLGPGYLAVGHRDFPADNGELVAWRSSDLLHWRRFSPPTAGCDGVTAHLVAQAAVVRDRLVAVGTPWSPVNSCGETLIARVTT
jgi:hypothetical protein